jgi:hypothetical protein
MTEQQTPASVVEREADWQVDYNAVAAASAFLQSQGLLDSARAVERMLSRAASYRNCRDAQWQDIATAPKDGTMILVAYDDSAARTGRLEGQCERVYEAGWDEQQATFADRNGFLLHSAATHWMPLPKAPGAES